MPLIFSPPPLLPPEYFSHTRPSRLSSGFWSYRRPRLPSDRTQRSRRTFHICEQLWNASGRTSPSPSSSTKVATTSSSDQKCAAKRRQPTSTNNRGRSASAWRIYFHFPNGFLLRETMHCNSFHRIFTFKFWICEQSEFKLPPYLIISKFYIRQYS